MAKYCPLTDEEVVYLECLDCTDAVCRRDYEKERFYLFIGGSWFDNETACKAVAGKLAKKKQIIIVSSMPQAETFAKKTGMLFRRSDDPVQDCLVLHRKPDSGALVFVSQKADEILAEKIRKTGITVHARRKSGN